MYKTLSLLVTKHSRILCKLPVGFLWFEGQIKTGLADNLSCTYGYIIGTEINVALMIIDFQESSCLLCVFVKVCSVIMYSHINLLLSVDCVKRKGQ